jgi:hypothetical protein
MRSSIAFVVTSLLATFTAAQAPTTNFNKTLVDQIIQQESPTILSTLPSLLLGLVMFSTY